METIKISSIESKSTKTGNTKFILNDEDAKKKYFFFMKKADGKDSVAYQQFVGLQLNAGKTIGANVNEEQDTFVNPAGKTINYTKRFITKFEVVGNQNSTLPNNVPVKYENPTQVNFEALEGKIKTAFEKRDKKISELEARVMLLEGNKSDFIPVVEEPLTVGGEVVPY